LAAQVVAHSKSSSTESSGSAWGDMYMIPARLALDNAEGAELEYTVFPDFNSDVLSQPLHYRMRYPYTLTLKVKDLQTGVASFVDQSLRLTLRRRTGGGVLCARRTRWHYGAFVPGAGAAVPWLFSGTARVGMPFVDLFWFAPERQCVRVTQ